MICVRDGHAHAHLSGRRRSHSWHYVCPSPLYYLTLVKKTSPKEEILITGNLEPDSEVSVTTNLGIDTICSDTQIRMNSILYGFEIRSSIKERHLTLSDRLEVMSSESILSPTMQTSILISQPQNGQTLCPHAQGEASLSGAADSNSVLERTSQKRRLESIESSQQQYRDEEESLRAIRSPVQAPATDPTNVQCSLSLKKQPNFQHAHQILPSFISSLASPIITLKVGGPESPACKTDSISFHVHRQILTKYSTFFSAAFGSDMNGVNEDQGWKERRSLEMYLPEDRAEDIGWLIKWLYWWDTTISTDTKQDQDQDLFLRNLSQTQDSSLWHPDIDGALDELRINQDRERQYHSDTCSHAHSYSHFCPQVSCETHSEKTKRPNPPTFGPLIRLYIIADKYGVTTGTQALQRLICSRVRGVVKVANCVPSKEDVGLLWENIIRGPEVNTKNSKKDSVSTDKGREHVDIFDLSAWASKSTTSSLSSSSSSPSTSTSTSSASTSTSTSTSTACLKGTILSIFMSLSPVSKMALFTNTSSSSSATIDNIDETPSFLRTQSDKSYHPEFLQDLLIRTLAEKIVEDEKIKEDHANIEKEKEREEKRVRFERMRVGKVRILG